MQLFQKSTGVTMVLIVLLMSLIWILMPIQIVGNPGETIDPSLGIPLFLKIITYDENFDKEDTDAINVYLVYERSSAKSYKQFQDAEKYFDGKSDLKVHGIAVHFIPVKYESIDSVIEVTPMFDYNMLICTSLDDDKVKSFIDKKTKFEMRSFTFEPSHLEFGFAISVYADRQKQAIVINLKAAMEEGSRFGAHLLKMCEIYERTR